MSLRTRLVAILCATAAIATALSLAFQDRTLARDLERAAEARLERSARAADLLVDAHLEGLAERYRAIAGTPQLRANLEVEDPPTLAHYAEDLSRRFGASRLAFVDARGRKVAASGDAGFDAALLDAAGPRLLARRGRLYALASVEIGVQDEAVGLLFAAEPIAAETLSRWSELCGANIAVAAGSPGEPAGATLRRPFRSIRGGLLVVESDLATERAALRSSRLLLLGSGLIALAGALAASLVLSRGLAAAMRDLLGAAERIGRGDLSVRLEISRDDEVGEVASAVNEMAERLEANAAELHARHLELVEAVQRAETASRAKTHFLANMSHEIRTPMSAVLGFTDLLLAGGGEPAEREAWAASVRRNGAELLALIDGILDLSRAESETLPLARQVVALRKLIEPALGHARSAAREKGLELDFEIAAGCPEAIETDPERLHQILSSLLRNAVKFCAAGRVGLRIFRPAGSSAALVFAVSDTGMGISECDRERIFTPFEQVDDSHTRRFGGAGLSLALSRRLAIRLGGRLSVESEPGRGSTFRLEIEVPGVTPPRAPAREPERRARVLVAEDGPDNQRLIRALLASRADVELVENGELALERAQAAHESGDPYDLLLMDMQMPVMDGYQATRRLREWGYTAPIVALTAHAMAGDRERCLEAGCDEYLTKPIDRARLHECVARFACERKADPTHPSC